MRTTKKSNIFLMAVTSALTAFSATAATTVLSPNKFAVDAGVAFSLGNDGASDYLFSWTGSGVDRADPTLVLSVGETYTFVRTSTAHPFAILDSTLAVTGGDGTFSRVTTDSATLDASRLTPFADFTADPFPSGDTITWTPSAGDAGKTFYYTCTVLSHTGMTGKIEIAAVPEPSSSLLLLLGSAGLMLRRKR